MNPGLLPAFQLAIRAALSAGLAIAIAELLGMHHPIYAMVGAVIVSDLSPTETRRLGLRRLIGTMVGAVIGHSEDPWAYGLHRMIETLLGVGIAILVSLTPKLLRTDNP